MPEHLALTASQAVGVDQQRADFCWASSIDDNGNGAVGIAYQASGPGRADRQDASVGKDHLVPVGGASSENRTGRDGTRSRDPSRFRSSCTT